MTDTTEKSLEKDVTKLFEFESLSEDEQRGLVEDIGLVVLEGATARFIAESNMDTIAHFEKLMDVERDDRLEVIIGEFPRFGEILKEEIAAFKEEASAVLG